MSRPDEDMVFRLDIGRRGPANARERAKEEREQSNQRRSRGRKNAGGRVRRAAQLRQARRMAGRRASAARAGASGLRGAARVAGSFGRAGIVGVGIGVVAVLVAVAGRIALGKPLESVGDDINRIILGDADEEARATATARASIQSDPLMQRLAAISGGPTQQQRQRFETIQALELKREKGRTLIKELFPSNGAFDIIALRIKALFADMRQVDRLSVQRAMAERSDVYRKALIRRGINPETMEEMPK